MIFDNSILDGLIAIAVVVAALFTIWTKAVKPVVTMANRVVELIETVEDVKYQVTPAEGDPYGHIRLVDRVAIIGESVNRTEAAAEAAVGEAHAAKTMASKCKDTIHTHAVEDQDNFTAVAKWSENFTQFDPIQLPRKRAI